MVQYRLFVCRLCILNVWLVSSSFCCFPSPYATFDTDITKDKTTLSMPTESGTVIIRRCTSPREAMQQLDDSVHFQAAQEAQQRLFRQFQQFSTSGEDNPTRNPTESVSKLFAMRGLMEDKDGPKADDQFVFALAIDSLPLPEYDKEKGTWQADIRWGQGAEGRSWVRRKGSRAWKTAASRRGNLGGRLD